MEYRNLSCDKEDMREIKFRAWDEDKQKMLLFDGIFNKQPYTETSSFPQYESHPKYHNMKLMQYTGLKDENGKEIYEGDVLAYYLMDHNGDNDYYRKTVEWIECGFNLTLPESSYEIIGNIYENQELVKVMV